MLYIILAIIGLWVLAAVLGVGKNTVFTNPQSLSDAQLERTIKLCERIMDNSRIGSKAWKESGDKFSAAYREQCRRRGIPYTPPNPFEGALPPNEHEA